MHPWRLAIAALSLGANAPSHAQTPDTLRLPASVSGYHLRESTPIQPDGGVQHRYASEKRHTIDVLIYLSPIPDAEAAVRSEARTYRRWVASGGYRKWFDRDSILTEATTRVSMGDTLVVPGHLFLLLLVDGTKDFTSYFHVQSIHGWIVKVRATFPVNVFDETNAFDFSRELTGLLLARRAAAP